MFIMMCTGMDPGSDLDLVQMARGREVPSYYDKFFMDLLIFSTSKNINGSLLNGTTTTVEPLYLGID